MKKLSLILALLFISFAGFSQLPGYNYYKEITIQSSQVAGAGSLTDFPVLIQHTDPDIRSVLNGGDVENANGYDIAFTAADGITLLDHQLEAYDSTTGAITAWVRIPSLSATVNTEIKMYYGNSSVSVDPSVTTTWDTNYQGVWHMSETGSGTRFDGTASNNATPMNYDNNEGTVGIAGSADNLDRSSSDYLSLGNPGALDITGDITVSAWVNISGSAGVQRPIVGKGDYQYMLRAWSNDRFSFYSHDGSWHECTGDNVIVQGQWYYVVGRVQSGQVRLFVDGAQQIDTEAGGITSNGADVEIGRNSDFPTRFFDGIIDEVRISNVARSDDWIVTNYNSIVSPNTFYTLGAQKSTPPTWCWAEDALAGGNEEFLDLATDPVSGVSYAVGYFKGDLSAEFPMGVNNTPDMSSPLGVQDGLVAKYDANGNAIWAFKIGNAGDQVWITGVEIGAGGNIFICGYFNDNCNFQGVTGSGSSNLAAIGDDAFLASYDSNGNLLWVRKGQSTGEDRANDVAVNGLNVYVTGWFQNSITWTNDGNTPFPANDNRDGFLICYDQLSGTVQWETYIGDVDAGFSVNDRPYAVAADNNNVYITGTFTRTTEFASNPAYQVNALSPGNRNTFLAEYNAANGNILWVDVIASTAGSGSCEAHGIASDANYFYVAGSVEGNVQFPGGAPIVNVTGSGEEIYACGISRTTKNTIWQHIVENDNGTDLIAEDIITDGAGNVYATGPFRGTSQFNGGLDPHISAGNEDCFVMAIKDGGTYLWTQVANDNNPLVGRGLGYDDLGGIYVAGLMNNQGTFGALPVLGDAGGDDAFVAKINCTTPCATPPNITACMNDTTVTADPTCNFTLGDYTTEVTAVDICGTGLSYAQNPIPGTVLSAGTHFIEIIVKDGNGLEDTCTFRLDVEADVNPVVVNCGDTLLGQTTGGQGNNGNNFSCTGTLTPGEDIYYQITVPTGNYLLSIAMDNVSDANDSKVNVFWVGGSCPLGSGCLSSDTYDVGSQSFDSNGQNSLNFSATGPGTYYFVVDSQNDSIDSYDISFNCIVSGIEFDESNCGLDVDNDGLHVTVDGSTTLDVNTCETVTICHTMYIENVIGGEWMDSVKFELGPCYTNITNITPTAPGPNGYHDLAGTWDAVYDGPTNTIDWGFNYSGGQPWGDGQWFVPTYTCGDYTFCFDATISSTCTSNNDLDINIKVSDDGVNGATTIAGFDFATSNGFNILNPPPTITCPSNLSVNNDAGLCGALVNGIGPTASGDNCPNPFITYTLTGATTGSGANDASGTTFNVGVTTVQYMIEDSTGARDSCQFTVTVNDVETPTITCPSNINVNSSAGCSAVVNGIAPVAFGDNCAIDSVSFKISGATTVSNGLNDASGTTFNIGVSTVIYTVTDTAGNIDTCSFTVTVNDVTNPTISCPSNVNIQCPAIVNGIAPTASGDNCGVDSISYVLTGATTGSGLNDASGTFFNQGVTTVTYTITDLSGNTATCSFTVTVNDNTNPTISCPGNVNASCPTIINGIAPTASGDNCGVDSISYVLSGATTGSGLNDASGTFFNQGVTTVTYTITDLSGNTATCSFTVTVNDATNPTISCPANQNVNTDPTLCSAVANGIAPTGTGDNCGIDSISYTLTGATIGSGLNDASGTFFNAGVTTVTYTITDLSGNTATCNFTITVTDNELPTITCPANQSVNTDLGLCSAVVNGIAPTSSGDNCGVDSVNYVLTGATTGSGLNDVSGLTFNVGITTITYTITDLSGNTASCNFTVTVTDNELPTITCPTNVITNNDAGDCDTEVSGIAPVVNDNCGVSSVSYVMTGATIDSDTGDADGEDFNVGVTNVTYYVTDIYGNIDSCQFTVTVNDTEVPSISCPSNQNVNTDLGSCDAAVNNIAPTNINDNCSIDSVSYMLTGATIGNGLNDASGTTFNLGITNVTYYAYDVSGNVDSCTFTITVVDNENPVINCPTNVSVGNNPGGCTAIVNGIAPPLVTDNCSIDSVSYVITGVTAGSGLNDASGTTFNNGVSTITYTVYDVAGNSSSCQFTVTVTDTTAPFINCPANQVVSTDVGFCSAVVNGIAPLASGDNCAVDSVGYVLTGATIGNGLNDASGLSFNQGVTTVAYIIYDLSGNMDSCSFTVTVNDSEAPIISCPNNQNVNTDVGMCSAIINGISPTNVTDNCSIDSVRYVLTGATIGSGLSDVSGTSFNTGTTTVTYIVYDGSGNSDSCQFTVTVVDNEAPIITCPNNIAICDTFVNVPLPNYSDNCLIDTVYNDYNGLIDATDIYPYGVTTVGWTVIDTSGNSNTCSMTVEVEQPPTAYAGEDQILYGINSTNFDATGTGTWFNIAGFGSIVNANDPTSFVDNLDPGENTFEWVVTGNLCPDATDEVIITYYPLSIPSGFSPNGDGDNDYFEIEGINLLENEVIIFNRWGVELFSSVNYQNNWDGRSDDGKDLPEDTYFYIIKIPGLNKELSGYVVLKR